MAYSHNRNILSLEMMLNKSQDSNEAEVLAILEALSSYSSSFKERLVENYSSNAILGCHIQMGDLENSIFTLRSFAIYS